MLEPPAIPDAAIVTCLQSEYALRVVALTFLPLGADLSTAVYRVVSVDGSVYFAKLRLGSFYEVGALVPHWLSTQGIAEVMAPLPACSGRPWTATSDFTLLLYPFVEGRDAYDVVLSHEQWVAFGKAIRRVHDAVLPAELVDRVPREGYSPHWRDRLRYYLTHPDEIDRPDPVALRLAVLLGERRAEVMDLVERSERLARALRADESPHVLCHTDLHAGNLLIGEDEQLLIVDWDAPLLAPRERDLMYPGGGQGFVGRSPDHEDALFYEGYGQVQVDLRALAYYRMERVVEDLAIFCQQLIRPLESTSGRSDAEREQALGWAISNFLPGGVLEIALDTARRLSE